MAFGLLQQYTESHDLIAVSSAIQSESALKHRFMPLISGQVEKSEA